MTDDILYVAYVTFKQISFISRHAFQIAGQSVRDSNLEYSNFHPNNRKIISFLFLLSIKSCNKF